MGTRRKVTKKQKLEPNIIILWLIYIAIGFMVTYIAHNNFGLGMLESGAIGAGTAMLIVVISEVLDRKLGWTKDAKETTETNADTTPKPKPESRHRSKKLPATAAEYLAANQGKGERAIIRGFVEQGGNADDIKAELTK